MTELWEILKEQSSSVTGYKFDMNVIMDAMPWPCDHRMNQMKSCNYTTDLQGQTQLFTEKIIAYYVEQGLMTTESGENRNNGLAQYFYSAYAYTLIHLHPI